MLIDISFAEEKKVLHRIESHIWHGCTCQTNKILLYLCQNVYVLWMSPLYLCYIKFSKCICTLNVTLQPPREVVGQTGKLDLLHFLWVEKTFSFLFRLLFKTWKTENCLKVVIGTLLPAKTFGSPLVLKPDKTENYLSFGY